MRNSAVVLISSIFLLACTKETEVIDPSPNPLNSHLDEFEYEAARRGLLIDLDQLNLTVVIEEIDEANVAGVCHYSSQRPNLIRIDQTFWNQSSDLSREMVVFHELGHCVLGRGHRESTYASGACVSIMQSGTGTCRLLYNEQNRSIYLDELFFPSEF